jgi:hypothetical protein
MPSSPIEAAQDDESVPPAVPVAATRRWWVIAGGAFAVAAVWVVATGGPFARTDAPIASGPASAVATTPVNEPPTVNPADDAAEKVAVGFLDAYAAFDAQKAMTYAADDADLAGVIDFDRSHQLPATTEGLSLMFSMLQAVGYEQTVPSCEAAPFGSDTRVVCHYAFHALGSDQIGWGPFSGGSYVFMVRDGEIVRAWDVVKNLEEFVHQMWRPFAEWVSSTYPKDAAVMYLDATLGVPRHSVARYSLESIRLWERHTREFVETRSAETAPSAQAAPDVQEPARCKFVQPRAQAHLELTQTADGIEAQFVLHQMTTPGHLWRIVLKHAHLTGCCAGPHRDDFYVVFEGTRLATGDSGDITVQRIIRGVGSGFVRAEARDRQTGQFCRVRAGPLL